MICPNCGKNVSSDQEICRYCGKPTQFSARMQYFPKAVPTGGTVPVTTTLSQEPQQTFRAGPDDGEDRKRIVSAQKETIRKQRGLIFLFAAIAVGALLLTFIFGGLLACRSCGDRVPPEEPAPAPVPTAEPTPELVPIMEPTPAPTAEPTPEPTAEPTAEPTEEPTAEPTAEPTPEPTTEPTPEPTPVPGPIASLGPVSFPPQEKIYTYKMTTRVSEDTSDEYAEIRKDGKTVLKVEFFLKGSKGTKYLTKVSFELHYEHTFLKYGTGIGDDFKGENKGLGYSIRDWEAFETSDKYVFCEIQNDKNRVDFGKEEPFLVLYFVAESDYRETFEKMTPFTIDNVSAKAVYVSAEEEETIETEQIRYEWLEF